MKKVLVIQQKMIGDVLTATVICKALKNKGYEVHYLINSHTLPVVENNPFVDEIIEFTPKIEKSKLALFSFLKNIRKNRYYVVVDSYGKLSSTLITAFSGAKIKIGYHKKHTAFVYSKTIKRLLKPQHQFSLAIENRLRLLEPLGIDFEPLSPKIFLTEAERDDAQQTLRNGGIDFSKPVFMISLLGSNPKKTYPLPYMAELLDFIISTIPEAQLLFNYIPNQLLEAKDLYNKCLPITQKSVFFNLYGKNLREFIAFTSNCNALIGNEGGAVNMAKALNIPTFIVFNPALNKANWFGKSEYQKHQAVHLNDYIAYDLFEAKKNPEEFYLKFKPTFVLPKLKEFLSLQNDV